jgi:hypothetical protein
MIKFIRANLVAVLGLGLTVWALAAVTRAPDPAPMAGKVDTILWDSAVATRSGQGTVEVLLFSDYECPSVPALINGTPYAELPPAAFYSSVIVHEVVHGILHQNLARPATSHAAYEYPAYALQIESLPQDVRERFLSTFEPQESERPPLFSDSILFFDPYFFAARAYEHFNGSEEGCDNLHGLMQGEVDFIIAR